MKRIIATAALVLASSSALANTGNIQFRGQINGATCPIDVVDPTTGTPVSLINLGTYSAEYFTAADIRTPARPFALWVRDGAACSFAGGDEVTVTYNGLDGEGVKHYLTKTGPGHATNVAIAITDKTNADVAPGSESAPYAVNDTGETFLNFKASIVATAAAVKAGGVDADVFFTVNLP